MRILIAEDEVPLATFVRKGLEAEHYFVDVVGSGAAAQSRLARYDYDLLLLDLGLPEVDGLTVLKGLRAEGRSLAVLVLTGRSAVEERVAALDGGADDYLVKPFSYSELAARVRALLRRPHGSSDAVLRVGDLVLDRVAHTVERGGRRIELTAREFALLDFLMRNAGSTVNRALLIEQVWQLNSETTTNVVDVYVAYSASQVDHKKVGRLAAAIQMAFQELGIFAPSGSAPPLSSDKGLPTPALAERVISGTEVGRLNPEGLGAVSAGSSREEMKALQHDIEQALAPQLRREEVTLKPRADGLVLSLRDVGFFESGEATIRSESRPAMDRLARVLKRHPSRVRIEGHTDNVPIHNSNFHSNWELSTARATEIVKQFITEYGIEPQRLSAAGYAEFHPVASNSTEEGRRANRRVDLDILPVLPTESFPARAPSEP